MTTVILAFLCRCGRLWDTLDDGWIVGHHQEVEGDDVVSYCKCGRELARREAP